LVRQPPEGITRVAARTSSYRLTLFTARLLLLLGFAATGEDGRKLQGQRICQSEALWPGRKHWQRRHNALYIFIRFIQ
jgi:hypothetical protein